MEFLETLRLIVVFLHLVGFALLLGAWAVEAFGRRRITRLMHYGFALAAVSGLALAAPWGLSHDLNYPKIAVKLVVLLVIGAFLGIGSARGRKADVVPPALFWSIGVLTLLNAGLAVLWR